MNCQVTIAALIGIFRTVVCPLASHRLTVPCFSPTLIQYKSAWCITRITKPECEHLMVQWGDNRPIDLLCARTMSARTKPSAVCKSPIIFHAGRTPAYLRLNTFRMPSALLPLLEDSLTSQKAILLSLIIRHVHFPLFQSAFQFAICAQPRDFRDLPSLFMSTLETVGTLIF